MFRVIKIFYFLVGVFSLIPSLQAEVSAYDTSTVKLRDHSCVINEKTYNWPCSPCEKLYGRIPSLSKNISCDPTSLSSVTPAEGGEKPPSEGEDGGDLPDGKVVQGACTPYSEPSVPYAGTCNLTKDPVDNCVSNLSPDCPTKL